MTEDVAELIDRAYDAWRQKPGPMMLCADEEDYERPFPLHPFRERREANPMTHEALTRLRELSQQKGLLIVDSFEGYDDGELREDIRTALALLDRTIEVLSRMPIPDREGWLPAWYDEVDQLLSDLSPASRE